jgi:hypothetical protein
VPAKRESSPASYSFANHTPQANSAIRTSGDISTKFAGVNSHREAGGAGNDAQGWYVGDFNGDGKDDIFRYNAGVSGAEVFLSNGSSFVSAGSWTGAGNDAQGWYVGDFNGDGRDDIFRYDAGVSGAEVFLSNGSSFVSAGSWTPAGNDGRWYIGDFNGDTYDDILRYNPGVSGAEVFLSDGSSSFKFAGSWTPASNGSQGWYVGDFNGGGAADVFRYLDGVSGADMWLSDPLSTVDNFRFDAGGGKDVITDFQARGGGHDVVLVDKNMFADFNSLMAHAQQHRYYLRRNNDTDAKSHA